MKLNPTEFLEGLINLPTGFSAQRSPDGKHIALNILNLNQNLDIFLTDTKSNKPLTAMTNTSEYTWLYKWWEDSKSILVGEDKDGDERVTLYRVFLDDPEKMHPLTKLKPNYYLESPMVSPDGQTLYYFANYDFSKNSETEIFHLFHHNLLDGSITLLTSPEKPADHTALLNLAGTKILYNRCDITPGGYQWWIINVDGTDNHEILNFGPEAKVEASWHPDSDRIVFVTDSFNGDKLHTRLTGIYSITSDTIQWINKPEESIIPGLAKYDFSNAFFSRYDPDLLVLLENVKARTQSYFLHLKKKELFPFPRFEGTMKPLQKLEDGRWLGKYYSSTQPTTFISFPDMKISDLSIDEFTYYFDNFSYSSIRKEDLVPAKDLNWTSKDGTPIHGWLYKSHYKTNRAIIYVHGGPSYHSEEELNSEIQYYAQGFNVLDPNYRGSTGYGVTFRDASKKEGWGGSEQVDIAMGAKALIDRGLAAEKRIGITGTSYGGFSSWIGITKFPGIFGASSPVCGMTDLIVDYESTRPDLRPYSAEMMGGTPDEVPERFHQGSPINYVQHIKGKILIVQGGQDPNVTPENVRVIEKKLKENNIAYEKLIFENEGHGIMRKENQLKKIIAIGTFFNKSL